MAKTRVLVIGGGISGLRCSDVLNKNKFCDLHVYEASNYLGGRICTKTFSDGEYTYPVEMGAQWIHGVEENPIFNIAQKYNLTNNSENVSRPALHDNERWERAYITGHGRKIPDDIKKETTRAFWQFRHESESFFSRNSLPEDFSVNSSFQDFIETRFKELWAKKKLNADEIKVRRVIMNTMLKFECGISGCDSMEQASLKQFGSYKEFGGPDMVIGKGYSSVIDAISVNIPPKCISVNAPVININFENCELLRGNSNEFRPAELNSMNGAQKSNDFSKHYKDTPNDLGLSFSHLEPKVKITRADENVELFDHVVCTTSLGYLKKNHHTLFIPQLPESKRNAIEKLGIDTVDKILVQFGDISFLPSCYKNIWPCWCENGCLCCPDSVFEKRKSSGRDLAQWTKKIAVIGFARIPRKDTLEMWLTGKEAVAMETLSDAEVSRDIKCLLQALLPESVVPEPTNIIRSAWGSHEYTCGSYSYVAVGSSVADIHQLAAPIRHPHTGKPLVLFAGEATHAEYYSTTHGAYLSGERAAHEIIRYHSDKSQRETVTHAS